MWKLAWFREKYKKSEQTEKKLDIHSEIQLTSSMITVLYFSKFFLSLQRQIDEPSPVNKVEPIPAGASFFIFSQVTHQL